MQSSLLKGHRKQLSVARRDRGEEKFIILFRAGNSSGFQPTRKRYIILNPKIASEKPIKEKKVFEQKKSGADVPASSADSIG